MFGLSYSMCILKLQQETFLFKLANFFKGVHNVKHTNILGHLSKHQVETQIWRVG